MTGKKLWDSAEKLCAWRTLQTRLGRTNGAVDAVWIVQWKAAFYMEHLFDTSLLFLHPPDTTKSTQAAGAAHVAAWLAVATNSLTTCSNVESFFAVRSTC